MKKYIVFFVTIAMLSCSNSDDEGNNTQDDLESWNMTQRSGFGGIEDYNAGDVVWTFNNTTQMLQIENIVQNITFDAGSYSFTMTDTTLTVEFPNETIEFVLTSQGNSRSLFYDPLPNAVDDELTFTFEVD